MKKILQKTPHRVIDFITLAFFSVFLLIPLTHPRLYWSHDEAQLLWRITEFHANASAGDPFCRWFPDFARGFGLPFLEFFPVLYLLLAECFKLAGASTIAAAKLPMAISSIFGSYYAYKLAEEIWGRFGGIIAGVLYTYAPYRIFDLYVRGDVNEYTAMAIMPFCFHAIYRLSRISAPPHIPWKLTGGVFALLLTHYPSVVIQLPLYVLWSILLMPSARNRTRYTFSFFSALTFALLFASPCWATAFFNRDLVQMQNMTKGFANYSEQFIHPSQWISFYWNFGASIKGTGDTVSFQIGNLALILIAFGSSLWIRRLNSLKSQELSLFTLVIPLVLSLFLTTSASAFLWRFIPLLPMIQFPYRLLQIPAFILAVLGGSAISVIKTRNSARERLVALFVGILIVLTSLRMCEVAARLNINESQLTPQFVRRVAHTHCTNEFTPRNVGKRFPPPNFNAFEIEKIPDEGYSRKQMEEKLKRWLERAPSVELWEGETIKLGEVAVTPQSADIISGDGKIESIDRIAGGFAVKITANSALTARLNQFYFQGWEAETIDGLVSLKPDLNTGLIAFDLPVGKHDVTIKYRNLPMGRHLSIFAFAVFSLICLYRLYQWSLLKKNA